MPPTRTTAQSLSNIMASAKALVVALVLALCAFSVLAQPPRLQPTRLGVAFVDEIRGITVRDVSIPTATVGTDIANTIQTTSLTPTLPNFSLTAGGPVELSSRNPVSISAQTLQVNAAAGFSVTGSSAQVSSPSISVSSIEGVTFTGNTVDVVSNQGQIIANAGNENTFHSTDTLTVISDHGNVNVAANNANNVNAQSFTLVGGNSQFNDAVSFGGNSLLDVHAAYDFWLRSQGTFVGSSSQDVQIFSDNGEVIVEAQLDLNASASADAQFVSQQDLIVESLLGAISVQAGNLVDVRAFNVKFTASSGAVSVTAANNVTLSAAGGVRVSDGSGGKTSVSVTGTTGNFVSPGNVVFTTTGTTSFVGSTSTTAPFITLQSSNVAGALSIGATTPTIGGNRTAISYTTLTVMGSQAVAVSGNTVSLYTTASLPTLGSFALTSGSTFTTTANNVNLLSGVDLGISQVGGTGTTTFTGANSIAISAATSYSSVGASTTIKGTSSVTLAAPDSSLAVAANSGATVAVTNAITYNAGLLSVLGATATLNQAALQIQGGDVALASTSGTFTINTQLSNSWFANSNIFLNDQTLSATATTSSIVTGGAVSAIGTTISTTAQRIGLLAVRDISLTGEQGATLTAGTGITTQAVGIYGQAQTSSFSANKNVTLTGNSLLLSSASTISFSSKTTSLSANTTLTFRGSNNPDDSVLITPTGAASFTAGNNAYLQGGAVSIATTASGAGGISGFNGVVFAADTSSAFGSVGALSVIAAGSISATSEGSTTFQGQTVAVTAPVTNVAAVTAGSPATFDASTSLTFTVSGTTQFKSDSFAGDAFGSTTLQAPSVSLNGVSSSILSGQDLTVTSPTVSFNFPVTQNIIGSVTGTTINQLPIDVCSGDLEIHGSTFTATSGYNVTLSPIPAVNTSDPNVVASAYGGCHYNQTYFSARAQAYKGTLTTSAALAVFDATNSLLVQGGEIGLTSTDASKGTIEIDSPNALPFTSLGGQIGVDHGARPDLLTANNGILTYLAPRAAQFTAAGINGNNDFDDFGVLLTSTADMNVLVGNGSLIANSQQGFRIATVTFSGLPLVSGPQNIAFQSTGDFQVNTTTGGVSVYASAASNANVQGLANAAVSVYATAGDVYVNAHRAGFSAEGYDGLVIQSLLGPISFSAGNELDISSTVVDNGAVSFFVTREPAYVNAFLDISLNAGSDSRDADLVMHAFQDFNVTSGQTQRWHQIGSTSTQGQVGLELVSIYGDIHVTSGNNLAIDSAGNVDLVAHIKNQAFAVANNAYYGSDNGRANVNSSRSVTGVSENASVRILANGGGGSVSIRSDSKQDLVVNGGNNIFMTAAANSLLTASQGITNLALTGSVSIGSGDRTLFHSGGKIRLESLGKRNAPADGAYFAGSNIDVTAAKNAMIDATTFTIGQTSTGSLASNPLVTINSGGSATVPGYTITSQGDIDLTTTLLESTLSYVGDVFDVNAKRSASFLTNGPATFTNAGLGAFGLFTVDAPTNLLHLLGDQGVTVNASSTALIDTKATMLLQATGIQGGDGFAINAARDFTIAAPATFQVTTAKNYAYYGRDFAVTAGTQLTVQNQPGGRGTLSFTSDGLVAINSIGAMLYQTHGNGPISIHSQAPFSDVTLEAIDPLLGSTLKVSSADTVTFQGQTAAINGRQSVSLTAPGAGITIQSSDATIIRANSTLKIGSVKTFSLQTTNNADGAPFKTVSSGTLTMQGANDVQISTELYRSDILFQADGNLNIANFLNPLVRLRGAISVESEGDTVFTVRQNSGSVTTLTDRIYIEASLTSALTAYQGITISSTGSMSNKIYLTATQNAFQVSAAYIAGFTAGTAAKLADIVMTATDSVTWNFNTADNVGLNLHAGGAFSLTATNTIAVSGAYGVYAHSDQGTTVQSTTASLTTDTSDVFLETEAGLLEILAQNGVTVSATGATSRAGAVARNSGGIEIIAPNRISFTSGLAFSIASSAETRISAATSAQWYTPATATFSAGTGVIIGASGRTADDFSGSFGVNIQSDGNLNVNSQDITMESGGGQVILSAVEKLNVGTATTTNVYLFATDTIDIESSYEAANFAPFVLVPGIQFDSNVLTMSADNRDITADSYDVSFSGGIVSVTSESAGAGTFGLTSSQGTASLVGGTITVTSKEEMSFTAATTATFSSAGVVSLVAEDAFYAKGNTVTFTSANGPITINANGGVTLRATGAFVDFQDDTLINDSTQPGLALTQTLRLPDVGYQASRNNESPETHYLPFVENEQPGCVERQLAIDDISLALCVCDRNKWRCINQS